MLDLQLGITAHSHSLTMTDAPPAVGHFEDDPRAHIDKETGKWQWESDSGQLFEYTGQAWIPLARCV